MDWVVAVREASKRGNSLELVGMAFLWSRVTRKALVPKSVWDFKFLMYDLAVAIGGVVCLVEAFRLR